MTEQAVRVGAVRARQYRLPAPPGPPQRRRRPHRRAVGRGLPRASTPTPTPPWPCCTVRAASSAPAPT